MKYEIPTTSIMGKPIKGSLERVLAQLDKNPQNQPPKVQPPNLSGYIYVPSANVYIAKERTLLGKNWYDCHAEIHKQNLVMPTIPQFIEFITYLKKNSGGTSDASPQEVEKILDDILTVRDPWRAQWLDAKFTKQNNQLYVNYNHTIPKNGNIICEKQPLEVCLMEDRYSDVLHPNKIGRAHV